MAITFPSKAWITGKNTLVLTLPSEINKKHDIEKGKLLIVTLQNINPNSHIEYSARGQFEIKTEQEGELNDKRTKNEKK